MSNIALKFLPILMDSLIKTPVHGLTEEQVDKYLTVLPLNLKPEATREITDFVIAVGTKLGLPNVGALLSSPKALGALIPQLIKWKSTLVNPPEPKDSELMVKCRHCGQLNPFINGKNTVDLALEQ